MWGWGARRGFSRLRGSSTASRIFADLFSPCVESSRRLALWQGFLQDTALLLLEVAAKLHNAAHGARMAPRGGLEGPRQARQGCSRYSRHRAGFSSPATRCAGNWSYVPQGGPSGSLSGQPGDRDAWSSSTPSDLVRAPEANYTRLPTLARPLSTDRRPFFAISATQLRELPAFLHPASRAAHDLCGKSCSGFVLVESVRNSVQVLSSSRCEPGE